MFKQNMFLWIGLLFWHVSVSPCYSAGNKVVILATTTSVQDTGLLDALTEAFQEKTGYTLKPIAVGTGEALKMGRLGQADILWVHSPIDEKIFVDEGCGIGRITFMHNDFVLLGPKDDPAGLIGAKSAPEAFGKIAAARSLFVSRADGSGTHKKENALWKEAAAFPDKAVYIEVGQGMAQTVMVANEKQGYVLTDRSTYLSLERSIELRIVFEGDKILANFYSLILVNPDKFPKVNAEGARALFDFLLSRDSREIIENFGKERSGKQLFFWDLE